MALTTPSSVPFTRSIHRRLGAMTTLALAMLIGLVPEALAQAGAPTVTITPAGGQYAGGTDVTVQIQFCDNQGLNLATKQILYNGQVLDWPGTSNGFGGTGPCAAGYLATGTLQVPTGIKELQASIEDNVGLWSRWTRAEFYSPARWQSAGVVANNPFQTSAASASGSSTFTVTNKGGVSEVIGLTTVTSGGVVVQGRPPTAPTLAAGASSIVTVNFTAPASGTGMLWLRTGLGASSDSAWTEITVGTPSTPAAGVALLNPAGIVEKSLCVTIAVGASAAAECGDLRLAHALPSVMTRGKLRQPVLHYSDQAAEALPAIGAMVTLPSGFNPSDTLTATW